MKEMERPRAFTSRQNVLRERLVNQARAPGVYRSTPLLPSSGEDIEVYHDFDLLVADPINARAVVEVFSEEIRRIDAEDEVTLLGFIEKSGNTTGAISLAGAISIETGIPQLAVRLWKDLPSERIKLPSLEDRPRKQKLLGENVVVVTDHSTTGIELLDAIETVHNLGGCVRDAVVYTLNEHLFQRDAFQSQGVRVQFIRALPREFQEANVERVKVYA